MSQGGQLKLKNQYVISRFVVIDASTAGLNKLMAHYAMTRQIKGLHRQTNWPRAVENTNK